MKQNYKSVDTPAPAVTSTPVPFILDSPLPTGGPIQVEWISRDYSFGDIQAYRSAIQA